MTKEWLFGRFSLGQANASPPTDKDTRAAKELVINCAVRKKLACGVLLLYGPRKSLRLSTKGRNMSMETQGAGRRVEWAGEWESYLIKREYVN